MSRTLLVLDPFCGTGTTLVECKKLGISSVGTEPNPMPCFASQVKVTWNVNPDGLLRHAQEVAGRAEERLNAEGSGADSDLPLFRKNGKHSRLRSLPTEVGKLLLKDSISPAPLHKTLVLLETLAAHTDERFSAHQRVALAKAIVFGISNLHFGPEVDVGPAKSDAPVIDLWMNGVRIMAEDLRRLAEKDGVKAVVHRADSRDLLNVIEPKSVDAVITSPPYPNEKDYTRTTRLESVLLGFILDKKDIRLIKKDLVRSNTRSVYKADRDDALVAGHGEIQRIAAAIERRRIELSKTSGLSACMLA